MKQFWNRVQEIKPWRKRPFYLSFAVFCVLMLLLILRLALPCGEELYEGSYSFPGGTATDHVAVYEGLSLSPGVYRVELAYETDQDLATHCNVADSSVLEGALLCNGEHFYSKLGKTGFLMWLFEGTEDLQVVVSYNGQGSLTTGDLTITETKLLWTMLLVILLFLAGLFFAGMVFFYYDKAYPVAAEKKHVFFCITVISLIASLPYLCGYVYTGADLTYHLQRIEGVKDGLAAGYFPVRLEPRWLYDYGYANGIFYCNTLFLFPAVLRLLGFTISASYNIYCIALNLATAWFSYWCFRRIFKSCSAGIVCSALYTLSIYRIYKLVITTAVGEGSALTFLPLVLLGLYRVFAEDPKSREYRTAWLPLALGYAGLMQTHVLTCEVTALVTLLLCLCHIRKLFCKNTFLELVKGALAAVLLSLWFLVPFLDYYLTQNVHIRNVSARTIQDRGLYIAHMPFHFWTTGITTPTGENGMQYTHPGGVGLVLIIGLAVFLLLWYSGKLPKLQNIPTSGITFTKTVCLVALLLLFMSLNVFPWDRIQSMNPLFATLVSSLQFPNRFLGWGTLLLVMLFGFLLCFFREQATPVTPREPAANLSRLPYLGILLVAVLGITTSSIYLLDHILQGQDYFELYNQEGMGFGYISGAEYVIEGTDYEAMAFAQAVTGEGVELLSYEKGALRARIACRNTTARESWLDIPLLLYKGYQAVNSDTGEPMELTYGENNCIRVLLPAHFAGEISVGFVSPFYWRISEVITAAFVVFLAVSARRKWRKKAC